MPSLSIVDIEALVLPVSAEAPHGSDIREDRSPTSDYYSIKDARNGARAAERANMFDTDDSVDTLSLWRPVLDIAPKILTNSSKDLEVLSWYTEALIRFHGFAGLRCGLQLTRQIVEKYWDNLYPEPDEDGMETKVAPLTGLNGDGGEGTLLTPIRNCTITTEGPSGEFSYWQYQQARDADKITNAEAREERFSSMGFNLQAVEAAVSSGNIEFYQQLINDLDICKSEYQILNDLLMGHCGNESPPSTNIRELLDEVLRSIRYLTKDKLAHLDAAEASSGPENETMSTEAAPAVINTTNNTGAIGPISGREDALKRLQEIAQYFRQYEPHTPLASSIDRVVSWGRMSVAELVMELVPDTTARAIYTQLTGVKLDGSDEHEYVAPPPMLADSSAPVPPTSQSEESQDNWGMDNNEPPQEDTGW
jgi:type VI secretion system protein ImpA